ncbi:fungal Zn, 2-cys(6) binuclear cluster domain protein, partial [Rhizoctonia solani AG-3 Rhs1AP]
MPRIQSAGSASTSQAPAPTAQSLKRNQACHQCRKRKLKCNAQKPCATCAKSHRLAVASNPALSGTEAECTYDEFTPENPPPPPEGPRAKYQRLEARINELEALLKEQQTKEIANNGSYSNTPPVPRASPLVSLSSPGSAGSPTNNLAVPKFTR